MVKDRNATGLKKHYSLDPPGRLTQSVQVTEAGKGEVSPQTRTNHDKDGVCPEVGVPVRGK